MLIKNTDTFGNVGSFNENYDCIHILRVRSFRQLCYWIDRTQAQC